MIWFRWAVLLTLFRSLTDGNCFYSAISVRLAGNNSLIHLGKFFSFYELASVWTSSEGLRDPLNTEKHEGLDRSSCKKWGIKTYAKFRFGLFFDMCSNSFI